MANRFHGVFSLILYSVAVAVGFFSMAAESMALGFMYLIVAVLSVLVLTYSFCTKCCMKDSCGHVFLGLLAKKLPLRTGAYNRWDIIGVLLPAALILLMPQTWLLKDMAHFIVFWLLVAVGGAEVSLFVCRSCTNKACPLNKG